VAAIAQPLSGTYEKALQDERKAQQLKQEQSTFEQAQFQDKCFFVLRVAMGVVAVLAIPAVITICSLIIFDLHQDPVVKRVAESTLFPSFIGLVGYVWRVFVRPASVSRLKAITTAEEDSLEPEEHESANRTINNDSKPRRSDRDAGSQGVDR